MTILSFHVWSPLLPPNSLTNTHTHTHTHSLSLSLFLLFSRLCTLSYLYHTNNHSLICQLFYSTKVVCLSRGVAPFQKKTYQVLVKLLHVLCVFVVVICMCTSWLYHTTEAGEPMDMTQIKLFSEEPLGLVWSVALSPSHSLWLVS